MGKNLTSRTVVVIVMVVLAGLTLYPPTETLKPGIDLAGGTSLIYEIDTTGLEPWEKKDLSARMITVLRRRIDPANIQNLIWRPQGSTRFEIQMPLASAEARQKRQDYERALDELLSRNIPRARILRSLPKPAEQRTQDFEQFAQNSEERLTILNDLAAAYDEREGLRKQSEQRLGELETPERLIELTGIDLGDVKLNVGRWMKLDEEELNQELRTVTTDEANLDLLGRYVESYKAWAEVVEQLTAPETGKNLQYNQAEQELDKFNLTEDQLNLILEKPAKSATRKEQIEQLKEQFGDRAAEIDQLVTAFDEYRPFRGRLDDPKDIRRMLKGAGILEFRILPTEGHAEVDSDQMNRYVETLKLKGPRYASDSKYVWCEIENITEWGPPVDEEGRPSIQAQFGDKWYVLASNRKDEALLHSTDAQKGWKLERARPTQD
ncbi:MAG: hypothetical protein ACYTEL_23880, partial [Planctomycetota bacterium]